MEDEEGFLEKVSLLLIITVVFLKTPIKYPDHYTCETRSLSEHIKGYLFAENTELQVCFTEQFFPFFPFFFPPSSSLTIICRCNLFVNSYSLIKERVHHLFLLELALP